MAFHGISIWPVQLAACIFWALTLALFIVLLVLSDQRARP
jgi:hypothetical protein